MLLLRAILIASVISSGLCSCRCKHGQRCLLQFNDLYATCKVGCSNEVFPQNSCDMGVRGDDVKCYCSGNDCYKAESTQKAWHIKVGAAYQRALNKCLIEKGAVSHIRGPAPPVRPPVTPPVRPPARTPTPVPAPPKPKITCGGTTCLSNARGCAIRVDINGKNCGVECSPRSFVNGVCEMHGTTIRCFCDKGECQKDDLVVMYWQIQSESNPLWPTDRLEKCLEEKNLLVRSNVRCDHKRCYKHRDTSCVYEISSDGSYDAKCSSKYSTSTCHTTSGKTICSCAGNNCDQRDSTARVWLRTGGDAASKRLRKKNILSYKTCGGHQCLTSESRSCNLIIDETYKTCDVKCSNLDATAARCEKSNTINCFCDGEHCFTKKPMITELINLRGHHPFHVNLKSCLTQKGVYPSTPKMCGYNTCFTGENSCRLVFDNNGCNSLCSFKTVSKSQCYNKGSYVECFCKDDDCDNDAEVVQKLKEVRGESWFGNNLKNCLTRRLVLSGKTCEGNACFKDEKSCRLEFGANGCQASCSAKTITKNDCTKTSNPLQCFCEKDDCYRDSTIVDHLIEQRELAPFSTSLDQCLSNKKVFNNKKCGEDKCLIGQNSCQLEFDKTSCSVKCSKEDGSKNTCKRVTKQQRRSVFSCLCIGEECYKKKPIIDQLKIEQKKNPFGTTLEKCLTGKGVLVNKRCDGKTCFVGNAASCSLEVGSSCNVECSSGNDSMNACRPYGNALQCFCKEQDCHKDRTIMNKWQVAVEELVPAFSDRLDKCLNEKSGLKLSHLVCDNKKCYKGRETCKVEAKKDGSCNIDCSTMKTLTNQCQVKGDDHQCFCKQGKCYSDKQTIYTWKMFVDGKKTDFDGGERIMNCIDQNAPSTTIRPLRKVVAASPLPGVFKGETWEQLIARLQAEKEHGMKKHPTDPGFTFKWWYIFLIIALLVTIGLFGIVIWSAATRKKRCAEYWRKVEEEKKKKTKTAPMMGKNGGGAAGECAMEVLPETDIAKKGPHHLDKKFKGEMSHVGENEKSESIHDKLEFVPELNEQVDIGSDVEIIDGMDQTSYAETEMVTKIDNFNTVRQATSISTSIDKTTT